MSHRVEMEVRVSKSRIGPKEDWKGQVEDEEEMKEESGKKQNDGQLAGMDRLPTRYMANLLRYRKHRSF